MNGAPNHSPETGKTPLWETLAMMVSFGLVWAYFLAFQSARSAKSAPHFGWDIALLIAVGVLILVLVRRVKRIVAALNSQNKRR